MLRSVKTGLCFGLTSGTITTLGLMVGLSSGTNSRSVVLGGILTIAIADSMSDALGIHLSEESKSGDKVPPGHIWLSTLYTFIFKFIFASSFIIPVMLFELKNAVFVSILYGFILLSVLSYFIAREKGESPWKVIAEHLLIAGLVVVLTHYTGNMISTVLN